MAYVMSRSLLFRNPTLLGVNSSSRTLSALYSSRRNPTPQHIVASPPVSCSHGRRHFTTTKAVSDYGLHTHPNPHGHRYAVNPELYDTVFKRARDRPEEFWAEAAEKIDWYSHWHRVVDNSNAPFTKWFVGGTLNACHNCVDRHVEMGWGNQPAIIHDSPVTNTVSTMTYAQLLDEVSRFAGVLKKHNVRAGDRVLIYMPMIPQAMIAMLASARIGAIHSLVFGGFAARELSTRINHAEPKVIVSSNCSMEGSKVIDYKPLLDRAINLSDHKPHSCIIYNRAFEQFKPATMVPQRDFCYDEEMETAKPHDCVPVEANHPLYLLYTSGTTGIPKAVVRPTGGHLVNLYWSMYNIYGIRPHETWFAASDLGWVVGHSYINYAPLVHCNTTVLYEGKPVGTPDAGAHFRILEQHNVSAMFVAPTAIRAIRKEDPQGTLAKKYKFPYFRYLFVAGEHCDWDTMEWAHEHYRAPVLDNWWQTETGTAITSTCVGLGNTLYPPEGVAGKPVPGWNVKVLKEDKQSTTADNDLGDIAVQLPLPPGSFSTLWQDDKRFLEVYFSKFPGYYDTSDSGYRDAAGNIAVMSRSDDVINVAGHRLSTGQLEEAILEHPDLAECAVVGIPDTLKGERPVGMLILQKGVRKADSLVIEEVIAKVREVVGPVASFKDAVVVKKLPKTRSGKIARNTIAAMLSGKKYRVPASIEDPGVYLSLKNALTEAGYKPLDPEEYDFGLSMGSGGVPTAYIDMPATIDDASAYSHLADAFKKAGYEASLPITDDD